MPASAYSMLNVTATLDGRRVLGYADGDNALQVTPGSDIGSMMVGADGTTLFSASADKSATITLRLKSNSPTHRQLVQKYKAQQAGRIIPFPFDFIERMIGEGGTAPECFIQKAPDLSLGTGPTVREWVLITGTYTARVPNE